MSSRPRKSLPTMQPSAPAEPSFPDMTQLMAGPTSLTTPLGNTATGAGGGSNGVAAVNSAAGPSYEGSDLNDITRRQLTEDIHSYSYDVNFCKSQLAMPDLTPQESRAAQLRLLDLGHQIRHCQHRLELIDAMRRNPHQKPMVLLGAGERTQSVGPVAGVKRPRLSGKVKTPDSDEDITVDGSSLGANTGVQRLGFWKCKLCTSERYHRAGPSRVPSAPCKWPLKDVSKMLNHYLDMHTEQSPEDRCKELGTALDSNRGPFEYWLTRTHGLKLRDLTLMEQCIDMLLAGDLPQTLKDLNRAAAQFPNSTSGVNRSGNES